MLRVRVPAVLLAMLYVCNLAGCAHIHSFIGAQSCRLRARRLCAILPVVRGAIPLVHWCAVLPIACASVVCDLAGRAWRNSIHGCTILPIVYAPFMYDLVAVVHGVILSALSRRHRIHPVCLCNLAGCAATACAQPSRLCAHLRATLPVAA